MKRNLQVALQLDTLSVLLYEMGDETLQHLLVIQYLSGV